MIELAMKTITAASTIGSQSAESGTIAKPPCCVIGPEKLPAEYAQPALRSSGGKQNRRTLQERAPRNESEIWLLSLISAGRTDPRTEIPTHHAVRVAGRDVVELVRVELRSGVLVVNGGEFRMRRFRQVPRRIHDSRKGRRRPTCSGNGCPSLLINCGA